MSTASTTFIGNESDDDTGTYPTSLARSFMLMLFRSRPSRTTRPFFGSRILHRHAISVDFPTPLGPRMETSCGPSMSIQRSFRTSRSE